MKIKKALAGALLSLILAGGVVAPVSVTFATDETTSVAPAAEVAAPVVEPTTTETPVVTEAAPVTEAPTPAAETAPVTEAAVVAPVVAETTPVAESAPATEAAPVSEVTAEQPIVVRVEIVVYGQGYYGYQEYTIEPGGSIVVEAAKMEGAKPEIDKLVITYEMAKMQTHYYIVYHIVTTSEPKTTEAPSTTTSEPKTTEAPSTTTSEPKTTEAPSTTTSEPKKVLPSTGETGSALAAVGLVLLGFVGLIGVTYKHKE